jgi:hypothetical protein
VDALLGSTHKPLNVAWVSEGRTRSSSQPDRHRVTANQDEAILILGLKLSCDSWILARQEVSDVVPAESGLASLIEGPQTVFGVFVALLKVGVILAQNPIFHGCLSNAPAHDAEIFAFKLLSPALAANPNDLVNTDVKEVLQKLVQGVVRVASA